jgi:hypothetical protein
MFSSSRASVDRTHQAPMTDMAISSRRNITRISGAVNAVKFANDEFLGSLEVALNEVSH